MHLASLSPDERHRIGRARLLRRQGMTYDEIRAVVGPVSDDRLVGWLRGIPRPAATHRSRALVEQRRECRRLRGEGLTYDEIAAKTGASAGSLSLWLRDVRPELFAAHRAEHLERIHGMGGARARERSQRAALARQTVAAQTVGRVGGSELFHAGLALYWAEGSKDKPWARRATVCLVNTDPTVVEVFLAWLDLLGVPAEDRRFRVAIHQSADAADAQRWWQERLSLPGEQFYRPTLKRHDASPVRRNHGETYHGCLVVKVLRSSRLYDAIHGWWTGFAAHAASYASGATVPGRPTARTLDFDSSYGGSTPPPGAHAAAPWLPLQWWDPPDEVTRR